MATHKAYVDDSGSTEDPAHSACSIAGFVGTADQWAEFEREWAIQLANFRIPYLHMREFAHHLPPFDQLTNDERKDALHALIQTINRCNLSGFGAVSLARRGLLECERNVRARGAQKMDAVSDIAGGSFGEAAPNIQAQKMD